MDVETNQSKEDSRLIERYLSGDEHAIEELVMKYQRKVYALIYRMTGDIEDSKDIAQKVFIELFRNIKGFRQGSSFYTWLYRIAINTCLNHMKKKSLNTEEISDSLPANSEGALSLLIKKEKNIQLRDSLRHLPDRQKTAVILRVYEGLSLKESAGAMNCSEGAVKAHYHNGMKKLKEIFKGKKI